MEQYERHPLSSGGAGMDDREMLEALELLVDREGQRGAAPAASVNRGTVADWIKRDTMTPRMRDAIERGLREYAEHLICRRSSAPTWTLRRPVTATRWRSFGATSMP